MNQLLRAYKNVTPIVFESAWEAPSNIAFVKYWGKKGHQIPANPSLSMALKECRTKTKTLFSPSNELQVNLTLEGESNSKFAQKIRNYLESLQSELPWIMNLNVSIDTSNTFPHGAGIASSASGLSAFALTFADYLKALNPNDDHSLFMKRASHLARLASGSACRSVFGGFSTWGVSDLPGATDLYASPLEVHPELSYLQDTVLVVSGAEKNISSTDGHGRMSEHFFAEARFSQAKVHFSACAQALKTGDIEAVGKILESEALSLHAMMLTSPSAYTLLKPNTLTAIEAIWRFRRETKLPLYFTLDAGPNLHLIYPVQDKKKIELFISHTLSPQSEKVIYDCTGDGPKPC